MIYGAFYQLTPAKHPLREGVTETLVTLEIHEKTAQQITTPETEAK